MTWGSAALYGWKNIKTTGFLLYSNVKTWSSVSFGTNLGFCGSLWVKNIITTGFLLCFEFETLVIHIFGPTRILALKYQLFFNKSFWGPLMYDSHPYILPPLPVPYQISMCCFMQSMHFIYMVFNQLNLPIILCTIILQF